MNDIRILAGTLVAALPLAAAAQAGAGAPVGGDVMFVSGGAERVSAEGVAQPLGKGMQVLEGDRIRTRADSHVYVRLRDGGLLVVRPASELRVELWRYDPARPQETQIRYTLDNGVARHVSGQGAKAAREKFRFNTPMAAIGVRGTDFTVLADPAVTRVSVQSGGVVVNGLGEGCRADALGPCEGPSAVELFASAKDKLVQVRVGERRPELIDAAGGAPDKARPPASGEPVASQPMNGPDVSDSRGSEVAKLPGLPPPTPLPEPVPMETPVGAWGRWTAFAQQDPGAVDVDAILQDRQLVAINRMYVLASNRSETAMALPGEGVADFRLAAHEGYVTDKSTGKNLPSTVSDARLSIDFGSRRFDTSMNVSAEGVSTRVAATGAVGANGRFSSGALSYSGNVQGVVGGKDAGQAMYIYNRAIDSRFEASGATSWHK